MEARVAAVAWAVEHLAVETQAEAMQAVARAVEAATAAVVWAMELLGVVTEVVVS